MRLVGRILLLLAGASVPTLVALFGCNVDSNAYPGIANDVPNDLAGPSGAGPSSSASGSSSSGNPANLCECAWAFAGQPVAGACTMCGSDVTAVGGTCSAELTACSTDSTCETAVTNVAMCMADGGLTCVQDIILGSPIYQALVSCQCTQCGETCTETTVLACNLGGGGGGAGGSGAGGGDGG